MRSIDADALVEQLSDKAKEMLGIAEQCQGPAINYYTGEKYGFAKAAIIANALPTIDAVPVVRCKECKWATNEPYRGDDVWICNFNQWRRAQGKRKPDFFCADGERRELPDEESEIDKWWERSETVNAERSEE